MTELIHYEVKGTIGTIKIDNPPVNALSVNKGVIQGILDSIKEGEHDPSVSGFLILGAGKNFSGGADISEFGKPKDPDLATLRDLFSDVYLEAETREQAEVRLKKLLRSGEIGEIVEEETSVIIDEMNIH